MQNESQEPGQQAGDQRRFAGARGYALAGLCVAAAFGVRSALDPLLGNRFPYMVFFGAVFVVIHLADTAPSLVAILAGFLLGDFFFMAPRHSLRLPDWERQITTLLYFLISLAMLYFARRARQALSREQAARQRLRKQEQHFRSLIEQSNDVIRIIDEEGFIRYQGPSAKQILGYQPEEMVGRNGLEFVHPDEHETFRKGMAQTLPAGDSNGRVVFRHRHKGGSWRVMEASGRLLSSVNREGKKQFVVNLRDITERRRLEEAHARLAAIVESSEDAIIGKLLDGSILSWNAAAELLYGYTAEEAKGRSIGILAPPDRVDEIPPLLERVGRGERINHFETVRRAKDGRLLDVSLSISPVRGSTGQIVAASTIARDISERKKAERERERLVQELQAALAEVKTLSGLLPICAHCKKIRDDQGYWKQIELYIRQHSNADFTHSICPECSKAFYPELFRRP